MGYDDDILMEEQTFRVSDEDAEDEAFDPLEDPDLEPGTLDDDEFEEDPDSSFS
ncbi:MAG: hypothetical protein WDN09_00865 [bacterium]